MNSNYYSKIVSTNELNIGDVLLGYKNNRYNFIGYLIKKRTKSNYTHAAIFIGDGKIAESVLSGVKINDVDNFIAHYNHVAVMRQPDAWSTDNRKKRLIEFINQRIKSNSKYNFWGVLKKTCFIEKIIKFIDITRNNPEISVYEKLSKYSSGELTLSSPDKKRYFCSEFVADCLSKLDLFWMVQELFMIQRKLLQGI